jgi:hypothetical protein
MARQFIQKVVQITEELFWMFCLAMVVSSVAWTVTHEEIFREPREFCAKRSVSERTVFRRKFYYIFTCEYCFSHYVTVLLLIITQHRLLFDDWRGYLVSGFVIVWLSNIFMSLYALLRTDIKKEGMEAKEKEKKINGGK